jgi:hypothetical protein
MENFAHILSPENKVSSMEGRTITKKEEIAQNRPVFVSKAPNLGLSLVCHKSLFSIPTYNPLPSKPLNSPPPFTSNSPKNFLFYGIFPPKLNIHF